MNAPAFKTEMGICHEITVVNARNNDAILTITAAALVRLVEQRDSLILALSRCEMSLENERGKIRKLAACLGDMAAN